MNYYCDMEKVMSKIIKTQCRKVSKPTKEYRRILASGHIGSI